ncbi:YceI family protein [Kribbella catacumbae]|uniref:YceI family protein n=1 Tax=Kribbella catacumbae TaxID=460086 RepID=UPI0003723C31|nr:YceI family protein [Kribbella catacumbae]
MSTDYSELTGDYTIDASHSRMGFVARHAMVAKVRGGFDEFAGSVHVDGAKPENSTAQVTIQAKSIDSRNKQRDDHLRSNDFLDMDNHPEITFVSTSVAPAGDDHFTVTGDLTIRGVTKSVDVDFEYTGRAVDPFGNERLGFEGAVVLNRKDFGVSWNAAIEGGGVLVSEKVTLEIEVSAIKNP